MEMFWAVVTIAVTLLGVAVLVLSAAEPLLVAVAERRGPRDGRRQVRPHAGHRGS
jgi:hypothetical protein